MSDTVCLENRVVLRVNGTDAETFLNGLLTNSVVNMSDGDRCYAALLTPQGKIISDMIVLKQENDFLLDLPIQADEAVFKKLKMFRLKAKVDIVLEDTLAVYAYAQNGWLDPRHPDMPPRSIEPKGSWENTSQRAYNIQRIKLGVPEQGKDFGENEVFPSDINMDLMQGVDFKKGCFVGQEVVSRMKRRGTTRKRTLAFHFPNGAPDSTSPLFLGEAAIGEITSSMSDYAMAKIRLDRMAKAQGDPDLGFAANEREAKLIEPDWLAEQMEAVTSS